MNISLFATCLTDLFYPNVAVAIVRILRRLGHQLDFPSEQTCCGQPAFNAGHEDEARHVARRMIEVFQPAQVVVSPSGSCVAMVRRHFPQLFEHDPPMKARAEALADKTFEFVEFLTRKLQVDWSPWALRYPAVVTYHYSCHLRGIGLTDEVPRLLQKIEGIEYRQLEKMDECCGFGGVFSVKYGDIAGAICREKIQNVRQTGAEILVVNDGGCAMNITGGAHREGDDIPIKHIAEILDEAMQKGNP